MGRTPDSIRVHLLNDLIVIRLAGMLSKAEAQLVQSLPLAAGRDLLKHERFQMVEVARPVLDAIVEGITGVKVLSLHHDLSTTTGEKVILFTLAEAPLSAHGKTVPMR